MNIKELNDNTISLMISEYQEKLQDLTNDLNFLYSQNNTSNIDEINELEETKIEYSQIIINLSYEKNHRELLNVRRK